MKSFLKQLIQQKVVPDERIEGLQNKIFKEVYYLVLLISILSIVLKTYIYRYDITLVITELVLIVVPAVYYGIRTIWLGIYSDELEMLERTSRIPMASKNVLLGTGFGIIIAFYFGVRSALIFGDAGTRLYYFFLVFLASLAIYAPFLILILLVPYLMAKVRSRITNDNEEERH